MLLSFIVCIRTISLNEISGQWTGKLFSNTSFIEDIEGDFILKTANEIKSNIWTYKEKSELSKLSDGYIGSLELAKIENHFDFILTNQKKSLFMKCLLIPSQKSRKSFNSDASQCDINIFNIFLTKNQISINYTHDDTLYLLEYNKISGLETSISEKKRIILYNSIGIMFGIIGIILIFYNAINQRQHAYNR